MSSISNNHKRIAKNTLMLYIRTLLTMAISLYTSRIVLATLGVDDYGIYNVVGGVVAMFAIVSGGLTSAISRFLTFELGKGKSNKNRVNAVFSTSINIQLAMCVIVILLMESIGVWFLNYKMSIPTERLYAANWVLQLSIITFCFNLISVPYNSAIIAHEKMSAFAYISILEVSLKLLIVYLLVLSSIDKLITYSFLLVCVAVLIRSIYAFYCKRHFVECSYRKVHDKSLIKEMAGFAGWNFFTNAAYLFNTQGINLLINVFFGVAVNAARGVAVHMEGIIIKFVNDFTTAINPQITKNYAAGNMDEMYKLVCKGAKFSYLLLLIISLPFMMETDTILNIWLKTVPDQTAVFFRLSIVGAMVQIIGKSGYTACMATGKIRNYVLWVTTIGCMVFPLTWITYLLGAPAYSSYIVFAIVYLVVEIVRLWLMKSMLKFPVAMFVKEVFCRCTLVTVSSIILPIYFLLSMDSSIIRFIFITSTCVFCSLFSSFMFGLTIDERRFVISKCINRIKRQ